VSTTGTGTCKVECPCRSDLGRLAGGGFVCVEQHGRHRYYRLAGPQIAKLLESVARLAPVTPIRSLREDAKANALRRARTCYNHLAGRLGVDLLQALLASGAVAGHDGSFRDGYERLSAPSAEVVYRLTEAGVDLLTGLGIDPALLQRHRHALRHCVDWSEQRHHLAGPVGSAIAERMLAKKWIEQGSVGRSIKVTDAGRVALTTTMRLPTSAVA
jgi:hypothetical protein